jgi:TrmH family RNA methyltransferase
MPFRIVQSKQNARLKLLRQALASPSRQAGNLAGIEGPNLLAEALRAGLRMPTVFVAQGSERLVEGLSLPDETEVLALPKELLDSALATETPQAIAALVEPPDWIWRDLLEPDDGREPLIVVLAGLQDPGNLGTLLRSAEAFGASGVVSLPGTVSTRNPKAVRASAGSVFRVPTLAATADECFTHLRKAGVRILTTAAPSAHADESGLASGHESARTASGHDFSRAERRSSLSRLLATVAPKLATQADLATATALIIGNEGNGVPESIASCADAAITIPCPGPVESLNAAVAASVLLYEASRQRSHQNLKARESRA